MARFQEFLATGQVGDVQMGMAIDQVEQRLGPADDRSVSRRPVQTLKYGSMELSFKLVPETVTTRLVAVSIHFGWPDFALPVAFDDWTPRSDSSEADFRRFAERVGLSVHSSVDGTYRSLVLSTGARVVFEEGSLHSVSFRRAEKKVERRQMSVSLPQTTLNRLQTRAHLEKISVQELIEKVLSRGD